MNLCLRPEAGPDPKAWRDKIGTVGCIHVIRSKGGGIECGASTLV
jgi:hypothetical protein